ncbi:MAG TPA: maleylpyruvate isomerase family mycothiol-dependent enzyme [Acidimicrobiales bacterium]|nr:maleylpyruvate isomerase family mycothiol-dependent enzyme [Acidimicrobiales bacterium]
MASSTDTYWSDVSRQRRVLADHVDALDPAAWDAPSWCEGWRVRDVLGHLVFLAEASQLSMSVAMVRSGFRPNALLDRRARALGDLGVPELADRLRAASAGRFHIAGLPRAVVMGEVVTHGADMLRPLGQQVELHPAALIPVLNLYGRIGSLAFGGERSIGVRLVATDCNWSHGNGDEVRGRAVDLLLLLANRRQVLPALSGAGVKRFG